MPLKIMPGRKTHQQEPVVIDGSKHSFAHMLAVAALAASGTIRNVPNCLDALTLIETLKLVFREVVHDKETHTLQFADPRSSEELRIPWGLSASSRSLFCLYPALLQRAKRVIVESPPQGCYIGNRPHDWYLRILASFGVKVESNNSVVTMTWVKKTPATITFEYPTMTGSVVAFAAAACVPQLSTVGNASVEPSCMDELSLLARMGGNVTRVAEEWQIRGGDLENVQCAVPTDRVHVATYLVAGLLSNGAATVVGSGALRVPKLTEFLRRSGCYVDDSNDSALEARLPLSGSLESVHLEVGSEPKFSSDWSPFALILLAFLSRGDSRIVDDVFTGRFGFIEPLRSFGLTNVRLEKSVSAQGRKTVVAHIRGAATRPVLSGGLFPRQTDIRGAAATALACLNAREDVIVDADFQLARGYGKFVHDLRSLGVAVESLSL